MTDVLVKFPSRARPELFAVRAREYLADPLARLLITLDADDVRLAGYQKVIAALDSSRVKVSIGNSKSKIEAVNDGLADEPWDLLILASDDMAPQRSDYGRRIAELFDEFWPDGDGVLHLNDGRAGRTLNTLCICDRKYFDRFGYVYSPAYTSLFADNEWQGVSEHLGRAVYVDELVIKHEWIGDHEPDDLHLHNETFYDADRRVYEARKLAGFPV